MIDHAFDQGLIYVNTLDGGREPVCRTCGRLARAHGAKPAVYGRMPAPLEDLSPEAEETVRSPGPIRRFLKWFITTQAEPVDPVAYTVSHMSGRGMG